MDWICSPELIASLSSSIRPVTIDAPLRQVLSEDFPKDCSGLPISGGWGYSQSDAIIFDRSKFASAIAARDFVSLEYHIVRKIVFEELIVFREKNNRFSGIDLEPDKKALIQEDDRMFDCLDFRISCWADQHWEWLRDDWERHGQLSSFDSASHLAKREASKIVYARQFWFDITGVFGSA